MDIEQLRSVLGTPELARLMDRLVTRLERGEPLTGSLSLQGALAGEREAVNRLVGRRPSNGNSVSVDLDHLDTIIRSASLATDLAEAVRSLRGPCTDRRAARLVREEQWSAVWESAVARVKERPPLIGWLDALRRDGTLRRLVGSDPAAGWALLQAALDVIEQLPCNNTLLAEFAARTCGNSHALDPGQQLSTLIVRALAAMRGEPMPAEPADRRSLWESFGVVCDELSMPAIVLNLVGNGATRLGHLLAIHATTGEPCRISTRQLLRDHATFGPELKYSTTYVCENISVLAAAAERFGPRCPPMVCIEGQPRTAACLLLQQLTAQGAPLRYHGDFDWAGVTIANLVQRRFGAEAWCMSTADYRAAAQSGTKLAGSPVDAIWDRNLSGAMRNEAKAVHEEVVLDSLMDDLAEASVTPDILQ